MRTYPDDYTYGQHECGSCGRTHYEPYEMWCHAERQRLFPNNFHEPTEADAKRTGLSLEHLQAIKGHVNAWEAMYDHELTPDQARAYVNNLAPLPPVSAISGMISALSVSKASRRTRFDEDANWAADRLADRAPRDTEAFVMGMVRPVAEKERLAEAERLVADLRAEHPEATEAELAALLVRAV